MERVNHLEANKYAEVDDYAPKVQKSLEATDLIYQLNFQHFHIQFCKTFKGNDFDLLTNSPFQI